MVFHNGDRVFVRLLTGRLIWAVVNQTDKDGDVHVTTQQGAIHLVVPREIVNVR